MPRPRNMDERKSGGWGAYVWSHYLLADSEPHCNDRLGRTLKALAQESTKRISVSTALRYGNTSNHVDYKTAGQRNAWYNYFVAAFEKILRELPPPDASVEQVREKRREFQQRRIPFPAGPLPPPVVQHEAAVATATPPETQTQTVAGNSSEQQRGRKRFWTDSLDDDDDGNAANMRKRARKESEQQEPTGDNFIVYIPANVKVVLVPEGPADATFHIKSESSAASMSMSSTGTSSSAAGDTVPASPPSVPLFPPMRWAACPSMDSLSSGNLALDQMDPSTQTTRSTATLKWTDYLLNDLDPSDEGWEMSAVLKELAKQYEAYDQVPHPFDDDYNIRWKKYFVLVFQMLLKGLPRGTVALEEAIEMLERPAAPKQVGPVIIRGVADVETADTNEDDINAANVNSADLVRVDNAGNAKNTTANETTTTNNNNTNSKKRPAEAMDQNDNNNNHDASHPNKRVMTTHQNYPALPPGTIFKVDTQSAYEVRVTEGNTPTFKFKSSGPARVQVKLNHGGVVASGAADTVGPVATPGSAAAPGAIAPGTIDAPGCLAARAPDIAPGVVTTPGIPGVPGSAAAPRPDVTNAPGTATTRAPAPDPPAALSAQATVGTITASNTVATAAPDPAPAVLAFATRASLAAPGSVGNANPTATGWEGMGFERMGFEEWSSISSMSSNTETDSDIA